MPGQTELFHVDHGPVAVAPRSAPTVPYPEAAADGWCGRCGGRGAGGFCTLSDAHLRDHCADLAAAVRAARR